MVRNTHQVIRLLLNRSNIYRLFTRSLTVWIAKRVVRSVVTWVSKLLAKVSVKESDPKCVIVLQLWSMKVIAIPH